jgi:hypothetical protein
MIKELPELTVASKSSRNPGKTGKVYGNRSYHDSKSNPEQNLGRSFSSKILIRPSMVPSEIVRY